MIDVEWCENKLSEARLRYDGRDPFGPWTDLNDIFKSLVNSTDRKIFVDFLNDKKHDSFWRDFINYFLNEHKIQ